MEFYKKAFGAEEIERHPGPDGQSVMYGLLKIGNSMVQVCDEFPGMKGWVSPKTLSGTTVAMHLYVEDADAVFQRAVDAGATPGMPVMDTFWGDRYGRVTDPWGHEWSVATHKKDLTPEEIAKAAEEFFQNMPAGCGS